MRCVNRARLTRPHSMAGILTAACILTLVLCALGALAHAAGAIELIDVWRNPQTVAIVRFTLIQATASAALSVVAALFFARALARRTRFRGRTWLIGLSHVALVMPSMVAALGVVAVHGRSGWVNHWMQTFGDARADYLYGLTGVLIAHVFFNAPLAARILLNGLTQTPHHHWQLARLYGMTPRDIFWRIDWPVLRGLIPGVFGLVFLLCFTSFAIVLTLGGGPRAATLETAIYQAIRFDFDLSRAVALSLLQIFICLLLALAFFAKHNALPLRAADAAAIDRPDAAFAKTRIIDGLVLTVMALFLLSPPIAVLLKTFDASGWQILTAAHFWRALFWSLLISVCAGVLSCACALALANWTATLRLARARIAIVPETIGLMTLLVPPMAFGAGLFLFLRNFTDALSLGPLLVVLLNALLTLAFALRIIAPPLLTARARFDRLCTALGLRARHQWRHVLLPTVSTACWFALAVACALSLGDLGVIALFGTDQLRTLPLLMYRLISHYRIEQAAVVALVLCLLCLLLFVAADRASRKRRAVDGAY